MENSKYVIVEEKKQLSFLSCLFIVVYCAVSLFIYEKYNWTWSEYPTYAMIKFAEYVYLNTGGFYCEVSEEFCKRQIQHKMKYYNDWKRDIRNRRDKRIAEDKKLREDKIKRLSVKYGMIKEDENTTNINTANTRTNDMVDLKTVLSKYKNISYKNDNRKYLINRKAITKSFINAVDKINKTSEMIITETILGEHVVSEFSHSTGYKIDIRTKDLTYSEIGNIMNTFKKFDFLVVFEYVDDDESVEIANRISKRTVFKVRKSDNGEHIDVDLSRDFNGNLKF